MNTRRGFRVFELLLVITIFGIVVLVGVSRYLDLGKETRRLGFELLAHNFTAAVAGLRVQWLVQGRMENIVDLEGVEVLLSPSGWPFSADVEIAQFDINETPSARCLALWRALLQNPMPASLNGNEPRGARRYHISLINTDTCRYELVTGVVDSHYFDYSSTTGQVFIQVPENKKIPDL